MRGMRLMRREQRQSAFEQRLELAIMRARDQRRAEGLVDRAVIGDFVGDIGAIEKPPPKAS